VATKKKGRKKAQQFKQPADAAWWMIATLEKIQRDKRNAELAEQRRIKKMEQRADMALNANQRLRSRASKLLQKVAKGIKENDGAVYAPKG
jgi:hypothetical protein